MIPLSTALNVILKKTIFLVVELVLHPVTLALIFNDVIGNEGQLRGRMHHEPFPGSLSLGFHVQLSSSERLPHALEVDVDRGLDVLEVLDGLCDLEERHRLEPVRERALHLRDAGRCAR